MDVSASTHGSTQGKYRLGLSSDFADYAKDADPWSPMLGGVRVRPCFETSMVAGGQPGNDGGKNPRHGLCQPIEETRRASIRRIRNATISVRHVLGGVRNSENDSLPSGFIRGGCRRSSRLPFGLPLAQRVHGRRRLVASVESHSMDRKRGVRRIVRHGRLRPCIPRASHNLPASRPRRALRSSDVSIPFPPGQPSHPAAPNRSSTQARTAIDAGSTIGGRGIASSHDTIQGSPPKPHRPSRSPAQWFPGWIFSLPL